MMEASFPIFREEVLKALASSDTRDKSTSYTASTNLVAAGNWSQIKLANDHPKTGKLEWYEDLCGSGMPFEKSCKALRSHSHYGAMTGTAKFYIVQPGTHLRFDKKIKMVAFGSSSIMILSKFESN